MPTTRHQQEQVREWLQQVAAGNAGLDGERATTALRWLQELGSHQQEAGRVHVIDERPQGPIVNPTPKDTMIQIRFRAKRGTVSISELEAQNDDT